MSLVYQLPNTVLKIFANMLSKGDRSIPFVNHCCEGNQGIMLSEDLLLRMAHLKLF